MYRFLTLSFVVLNALSSMAQNSSANPEGKKYTSITPSAYALIKLKAYTKIPFAKETAALLAKDSVGEELKKGGRDFFKYIIHFENRYWTVDKMLARVPSGNILEFSSGYSFRGLSRCMEQNINFIDTDLPYVIDTKKKMVNTLLAESGRRVIGNFQLLPLNVFNQTDFTNIVNRFPPGPVTIINEGLLVYFNDDEKRQLCSIIHHVLENRGGYWITADIYVKTDEHPVDNPVMSSFRMEHHLDENRFDNYEAAEKFFKNCGFEVVYRESLAIDQLSCLQLLSQSKRDGVIEKLKNSPPIRQTWCLRVAQ
jgi:hypothetical protein